MHHKDDDNKSTITDGSEGDNLDLENYADYVIEKSTPSLFYKTDLQERLQSLGVTHVFITGFNAEYCPITDIAAYDDEDTYEFTGLVILDFIGTVQLVIGRISLKSYSMKNM